MSMNYILDKKYDETFTINFIGTEEFKKGDTLKLTMPECIKGLKTFDDYSHVTTGETDTSYLKIYFRYKYKMDADWSQTKPISDLTQLEICDTKCFQLELIYFRVDEGIPSDEDHVITLTNPSLTGTYKLTKGDAFVVLTPVDPVQILEIGDMLKIFSISDFQIIFAPRNSFQSFKVKYRFSQDDKLSWTQWEDLTKENITTVKWDKNRFVELQYLFELQPGSRNVKIYEVILYGDFQNVTLNSKKINLFGLKENCINLAFPPASITDATSGINDGAPFDSKSPDSTTTSLLKEASEYQLKMNWLTQGLSCYSQQTGGMTVVDQLKAENDQNSAGFWNPYEFEKITKWHETLAGQLSDILGMQVEYHLTDPDGNGIDKVMHEYQLYNITDYKMIKVMVPDNQFPDNQIVINQFNLDLFDTFKIHILKSEFKKAFGVHKRPSQEDILYFCQTNRMYIVKHAQVHKEIMNAGIYYIVVLEKYEKRANVLNRIEESKDRIEQLTRNTTIDSLFGFEEENDFKKIANKEQLKPKSFDYIRSIINARTKIIDENIYNGDIKVLESYYDISNVAQNEYAIEYTKADNNVEVSDNRSFIFWFNLPNDFNTGKGISKQVILGYDVSENPYIFLNNMDDNGNGYMVWFQSDKIYFKINDIIHIMNVNLLTNIWYALLINFDQRQRKIEMKLVRRNAPIMVTLYQPDTYERLELDLVEDAADIEYEINVNGFKPVDNTEIISPEANPSFIEESKYHSNTEITSFNHSVNFKINGSKLRLSNIRVFNDLVREEFQQIVLNELIIKDAQHLILGDNATKKIFTTNYPNKNWR